MSGFTLEGKHYETADLSKLQVIDQIRLERWLAAHPDLTDLRSFEQVLQVSDEAYAMDEATTHPDFKLFVVIGIWAAQIQAGEKPNLDDCGRYSITDLWWDSDEEALEPEGKAVAVPDLPPDPGGSDAA